MTPCVTSCLVAVMLGLASFPNVKLQDLVPSDDLLSKAILPPYCQSECSPTRLKRETEEDVDQVLKKYPEIQKEIEQLEAESQDAAKIIPVPVSRCPCSSCKAEKERLYSCGKCRIIWPFSGLYNTKCVSQNSYCSLGCGCPGRCNASGPTYKTVVLFCREAVPPFVIKRVRTCSNCCCQYNYWWKGK